MTEQDIENATKATQTAELLLSDLQELARCDAILTLLVLPEIERVAGVMNRLKALSAAMNEVDRDGAQPAP